MEDPVEAEFRHICKIYNIKYTEPEKDTDDKANVDFWLPDYDLYVEVKQFHTDRINGQIQLCEPKGVMVLVGHKAVRAFGMIIKNSRRMP